MLIFSRLVQLPLDEAVDFCITTSQHLNPDVKKEFFIQLIEEIGCRLFEIRLQIHHGNYNAGYPSYECFINDRSLDIKGYSDDLRITCTFDYPPL